MIGEVLVVISIVITVIIIAVECWKVYLNETKLKAFHHQRSIPIFGQALHFLGKNNKEIMESFCQDHDDLTYTWVGPVLIFHAANPEDFQSILTSEKCLKKAFVYEFLYNRTGILTSEPRIWKEHRRALNPTLGPKMVTSFIPIFNEKSRKMVDLMERKLGDKIDMQRTMFVSIYNTV